MNKYKTALISIAFASVLLIPAATQAATMYTTYTSTNAGLYAQLQSLLQQAQALKQQIANRNLYGYSTPYTSSYNYGYANVATGACYTDYYGYRYCPDDFYYGYGRSGYIDRIRVDFSGSNAQVRVEYGGGKAERYTFRAYNLDDVARTMAVTLGIPQYEVAGLISNYRYDSDYRYDYRYRNGDDIRDIDVDWDGDDADVVVKFRNDGTDRFTLRNVDRSRSRVIERLADRYDVSERDIRDVIDFN